VKIATKFLQIFISLTLLFYATFIFINAPTISRLIKQKINPGLYADTAKQAIYSEAENTTSAPQVKQIGQTTSASSTDSNSQEIAAIRAKFKNDWVYYPSLGIEAPVEWDIEDQFVKKVLPDELVHLKGTGKPETGGEGLIVGHSSYYWWSKGKYKTVFAPLIRSKKDDQIIIKRLDRVYLYKVTDILEMKSTAKLDLKTSGQSNMYFMTCIPVGTNLRRLVIKAELQKTI
jgi:LPXTG-site transpeptidase (sortase) family protein